MDSLQTDSTLHTFLFHSRVCGPHMNFRQVNREALARTVASPYIKARGGVRFVVGRWSWSVKLSFIRSLVSVDEIPFENLY